MEKKSAVGVPGIRFALALVGCTEFFSTRRLKLSSKLWILGSVPVKTPSSPFTGVQRAEGAHYPSDS